MATEGLKALVEELAAKLVETDSNNLQDLAGLLTCVQKVSEEASKESLSLISHAASQAAALVEKIILDEIKDRDASCELLSDTVTSIQSVVRDGRKESEVSFPEGLGLKGTEGEKQPSSTKIQLPSNVDEEIFAEFLSQQDASLQEMEEQILLIEKEKNQEALASLRRRIHTLKGEAGALGIYDIQQVCHATEDYLSAAGVALAVDRLLLVKDWLLQTFKSFEGKVNPPETAEKLIAKLKAPVEEEGTKAEAEREKASARETSSEIPAEGKVITITGDTELIAEFITEAKEHLNNLDVQLLTLETEPENEEILNAIFRVFHTIKGAAGFLLLEEIAKLAHQSENLLDKARKKELLLTGPAIDVIFSAVDTMKQLIEKAQGALSGEGTFTVERSFFTLLSSIEGIASGAMKVPPLTPETPKEEVEAIPLERTQISVDVAEVTAKAEGEVREAVQALRGGVSVAGGVKVKEAMRVDSDRLDLLVDTIGELVIIASMISQDGEIRHGATNRLLRNLSQMDKITRELQDLGLSLRMVPVKSTFQKMARMVRDLAKKAGKKIEFEMSGEDTELDRSVVDAIGDPLIHLVRNAVDHGIEGSSEERRKVGKSEAGRVELHAFHKGGNVYIQIKDDGRGLNREAILTKAIEKGLLKEGQSVTDHEIYNLIFAPGFSTAKQVTDVSGRGVGMDVVKRNIDSLRGSVEIETKPGKGSTFSLRLPLTLAIIDGMVVKVGEERYIIPTISIVESLRPKREEVTTVFKRGEVVKVRGELIPLFRVSSLFNSGEAKGDITEALVVVVEEEGKQTGLLVDDLIGQQSTVIKSLGGSMQGIVGISGATIMADGRVGLILDVAGIVKLAANGSR